MVSVRKRGAGDQGALNFQEFVAQVKEEIDQKHEREGIEVGDQSGSLKTRDCPWIR